MILRDRQLTSNQEEGLRERALFDYPTLKKENRLNQLKIKTHAKLKLKIIRNAVEIFRMARLAGTVLSVMTCL